MITQSEIKGRRVSGARIISSSRKKRLFEKANNPTLSKVGKSSIKKERIKNGNIKLRIAQSDVVNLFDPKAKKHISSKILGVVDNVANKNYIRRNILTKGTIINTDKGEAIVTNRPGQEGVINAVLVKK